MDQRPGFGLRFDRAQMKKGLRTDPFFIWRGEWDCWDHPGPRPFGPDTPKRASSKIVPDDFVEPSGIVHATLTPK